jgi:hypothetical protein
MPFFMQDGENTGGYLGNAGLELAVHACVVVCSATVFESGVGSKALCQHPL